MGVEINIRDQRIFNEFKNGYSFGNNPADSTYNLAGSVMENIRIYTLIEVGWFSKTKDNAATWTVNTSNGTLQSNAGNFITDGFAVGDEFYYEEISGGGGVNFTGQITSVSANNINFTLLTGSRANTDSDAIIRGVTPLTASTFKFNLLGNTENFNVESKVSENDQGYYASNIGFDTGGGVRDTNFVLMNRLGQYADWDTGALSIRFVSDSYTPSDAQRGFQLFEIYHNLTITPYYLEGELTNLQNNIIPPLLNGLNSLKYAYSPGFRTVLSNPNTEKVQIMDVLKGSVAWFNENYNGFNNYYEVESVTYQDANTLTSADGLLVAGKTRITAVVNDLNGTYTGGERFGIYVSYLPEQSEYQNTTLTNLKDNFIYDRVVQSEGQPPVVGGDFITNAFATVVGGKLQIEFDVEYSTAQQIRLSNMIAQNPIYFLIGIQAGDINLPSGNSDRVIMLADVGEYDESPDIAGLMDVTNLSIYPHNEQIGVGVGSTNMVAWNEDGLAVEFAFKLDLNLDAFINTLDFKLIAHNSTTNSIFELDNYSYAIGGATVSGGVQQLNINTDRNYVLKAGDQFNDIELNVGSNILGDQFYSGRFSQKISWQEWLSNLDVDTIFYNAAEPNDNLNFKVSNYSALNGYDIKLAVSANLFGTNTFGTSGLTDYIFLSPAITVFDYALDGNVTPVWGGTIETFNPTTMANLNLSILTGQDTLFRTTWVNSGGPVTSLVDIWGINRIEETDQVGYEITEMSSLNDPATSQLLIPSIGTKLNVYLSGGNVIMECLIDGSLATAGTNYNLSSRIQNSQAIIEGKLTSPLSELKDTSGTVETKTESP
jgi:hypothetical protein